MRLPAALQRGSSGLASPRDAAVQSRREAAAASPRFSLITASSSPLSQWRKSRSPSLIHDARISAISLFALSIPHSFLLCVSSAYGVASRSDPFAGKVASGFLSAGGGVLTHAHVRAQETQSTAAALDCDARRVIWGDSAGDLCVTLLRRQGSRPRGLIQSIALRGGPGTQGHQAPITALAPAFFAQRTGCRSGAKAPERMRVRKERAGQKGECFASADAEGEVKIWHAESRTLPLWATSMLRPPAPGAATTARRPPQAITTLDLDVEQGMLCAGDEKGNVVVWRELQLDQLLALPALAFEAGRTLSTTKQEDARAARLALERLVRRVDIPCPLEMGKRAVESICIERSSAASTSSTTDAAPVRILVQHANSRELYRCEIDTTPAAEASHGVSLGASQAQTTSTTFSLPASDTGVISCILPDFDHESLAAETPSGSGVVTSMTASAAPSRSESPSLSGTLPSAIRIGPSLEQLQQARSRRGEAAFRERPCVWVGSSTGGLYAFDWLASPALAHAAAAQDGESSTGIVYPAFSLAAHHTRISALDFAPHAIAIGGVDGSIKVFSPLTGSLLRVFNERTATRHAARALASQALDVEAAARFAVRQISIGPDSLVAAVGADVLAWRSGPPARSGRRANALAAQSANEAERPQKPPRTKEGKFVRPTELREDVEQMDEELRREKRERASRRREGIDVDGLDEMDALELALMLSRDEAEANGRGEPLDEEEEELRRALRDIELAEAQEAQRNAAGPSGTTTRPPVDDVDHLEALDSHDDMDESFDSHDLDDDVQHLSLSPTARPIASRSRRPSAQRIGSSSTPSPSLRPLTSPSRAWDILASAGSSSRLTTPASHGPDAKIRTIAVPRSARVGVNGHNGGSSEAEDRLSPDLSPQPSPSPLSRSAPRGAWALGSPSLRAALAPPTPPAPAAARRGQSVEEREDEELRFAIELSLAEERSRTMQ
jgi:hypothetical protein